MKEFQGVYPKTKSQVGDYTIMIHPTLEYALAVWCPHKHKNIWCPHKHKNIQPLEKVQSNNAKQPDTGPATTQTDHQAVLLQSMLKNLKCIAVNPCLE